MMKGSEWEARLRYAAKSLRYCAGGEKDQAEVRSIARRWSSKSDVKLLYSEVLNFSIACD